MLKVENWYASPAKSVFMTFASQSWTKNLPADSPFAKMCGNTESRMRCNIIGSRKRMSRYRRLIEDIIEETRVHYTILVLQGRCHPCNGSIFGSAMSCSWCKRNYHEKESCKKAMENNTRCDMGEHFKVSFQRKKSQCTTIKKLCGQFQFWYFRVLSPQHGL